MNYSPPDKINMAVARDTTINSDEAAAGKQAVPVTQKSTFQRSNSKHLFVFTRPGNVWMIACAVFTAALAAAGRAAYTIVFGRIFDLSSQWGANAIAGDRFLSETSQWCIYMCLIGLGMWLVSSIELAFWVISGELRARTARDTLFASLLKKTAEWYDLRENGMSSFMVAVQTQTRELQIATSQVLGFLAVDIFVFLACIILALVYSYQLTLVMLATGVPSALILWTISRFLDPAIEAQRRELAKASQNATAAATAIELVKVYNGADHEAFRFISTIRRSAKYYSRQALCNCGQLSYTKLWMLMLFVVGFFFAVNLVGKGQLTPGNALTTFYAALIAFQSIQILGPQWLIVAKGMAAGQSLQALVSELQDGQQVDKVSGCYRPSSCFGNIHMHNVSFAYPSNPAQLVLSPSNFHFPAGEITFVVGRSGSGKSTLGNLLLRFYEPLTGDITMDGNTITRLDLEWVRRNITLVQQSSILFRDTFFQNVAFGAPDPDHVSADEVQEACSMALLQSTITGMPHGMETVIGPGGCSLSGGQRQRLALARAKLRDPPVLILDEITSGLDPVSRSLIMEAIRIWRKGKTTIIITHEVGYIADDEYVYVLEDGHIVQEGERKRLAMVPSGLFASLLASADDENQSKDSESESEDSESESESELGTEFGETEKIEEARYVKILRGFSVNNTQPGDLFPRMSLGFDAPHDYIGQLMHSPFASGRESLATAPKHSHRVKSATAKTPLVELQRPPTMHIVTTMGLEVQGTRHQHVRQSVRKTSIADSEASLDSLELFLERLAKGKEKHRAKLTPSRGPPVPSVTAILRTVWPTLDKTAKAQLILAIFMCIVVAGSNPVFSYIFAQLLSMFYTTTGVDNESSKWAGILAAVAAIDATATFSAYFLMEQVAQKWVNTLRAEAIKRILSQPKAWFDKGNHSPSRIAQCLDRNAEEIRKLVGLFVPISLTVLGMILAALIWALVIRWDMTLVTLAGLPVAIGAARLNALVSDKWEAICNEAANSTSAIFSETFSNIKVVRAFTLEKYFTAKHSESANATYRLGLKRAVYVGVFYGFYQSILFFLTALVFFYGAKILAAGGVSVTDVLRVVNMLLFSLGTSVALLGNLPQIAAAKATATQLLYFANLSYTASHEAYGTRRVATPLPVRMTNLRFAYPSAPKTQVLRNINLEINPGTCTAIVGASGCGKSTIAALLLRLYEPTDGDILSPTTPLPPLYEFLDSTTTTPSSPPLPHH
ncbi:hypothetical protein B0T19DRAFT_298560 [Cercophora scortea]|uniref:Uncharacterized protein n=1 Tax=Cercophora scortea TaxID=314031 RepID=A0AAE0M4Q0_9PEZI|nr:hypothetical protein B0T19DRAFT_298560 [Cercophora scortea]